MLHTMYRWFQLDSLKKRLRFWITLLILLFVVLSYFPFFVYGKDFREQEAQNSIQQMINLQHLVIGKWFEERKANVHVLSQLPVVKEGNKGKIKEVIRKSADNYTEFSNIVFVNKKGMSETSISGIVGTDISDRLYFKEAKKGKSYVTDVLIDKESNKDVIIFSSPVLDYENKFQGLIVGVVRLDAINEVMKNFRFSETGQTYLVDRTGRILTETRFKNQSSQQEHLQVDTDIFHLAMQGKPVIESYEDYRGVTVLGDYRLVNDDKWLIIGEIAKNDIFSPFHKMVLSFSGALIIVLLISFVITFQLSNRIDKVIHNLLKGVHQIGKAQYGYRIEPSSYASYVDELQELCQTFNQMSELIEFQVHSVQKSEERYRALVESSPNAIVVHQGGHIVYANPRFAHLLKIFRGEDLLGLSITKYIHPSYREIVEERIQQLERNEPVGLLEEKYVCSDGSVIDVEVVATPIEYMDKPAFQVIIQNISERKKMERELNESQEQYRSVVENVKSVIFQSDIQGVWMFLNKAWEEITGYTVKESVGKSLLDYVHPDEREQTSNLFQSLIDKKQDYYRHELRFMMKSGRFCWIEIFARPTIDEKGQIMGISGTLDDITHRKESNEELRASEERFRLLAEYSSDLITLHDVEGTYLYVSPACKEILHYEEKDLVGKDSYLFIHPDDQELVKQNHHMLLKEGYTTSTYRIRRKDGEYVWFESTIKLLAGSDADEPQQIVVSRNISERKLAEQRLQEANEILQRLSTIDGLTGVSNRRAFDEQLEVEWNRSLRNSSFLSMIMLDIDYFKAYNDTYGHQDGDACLNLVAIVIQDTLGRATDHLFRYGGEEFAVILPETDQVGAKKVGEKIRRAVEALQIPHAGSKILPFVTISVGTATMIPNVHSSVVKLIANADKSVYQAKHDGRNCVRSYE